MRFNSAFLNKRLNELRITQTHLANQLGVTPQAVQLWCSGAGQPRVGKVLRIANSLKCDPRDLIVIDDELDQRLEDAAEPMTKADSCCSACKAVRDDLLDLLIQSEKNKLSLLQVIKELIRKLDT